MSLPSLRRLLTTLYNDIKPLQANNDASDSVPVPAITIEHLPKSSQTALIALHQIYPQLLLPALDLLDNALVSAYAITSDKSASSPCVYYVRSSRGRTSRYNGPVTRIAYEVRPTAWHCTCPAYAFSAFSARNAFDPFERGTEDSSGQEIWGGETRGGQLAICKHLLAVVIGKKLNVIPVNQVDKDTLANYALGAA
jgi:hypothetical protein